VSTSNRDGADGPAHWRRLIKTLTSKSCSDQLPICCPRHHDQSLSPVYVRQSKDFPQEWSKFCTLPCQAILDRCNHKCLLKCHSPTQTYHNQACLHQLQRPCTTHAEVPFFCKDLKIDKNETIEAALARFECPILVDYKRTECEHIEQVPCFIKTQLCAGTKALEVCKVEVNDYIHPVCNHRFIKPKCYKKREYEQKPPICTKVDGEAFKRPCGCTMPNMKCFQRIDEMKQPPLCLNSVEVARPRCGHQLSLRCSSARNLLIKWDEQSGHSGVDSKFLSLSK